MGKIADDLIEKAKAALVFQHAFWGTLALHMRYVSDPMISTAMTDGKQIRYNPKFIENKSLDYVKAVIAHECGHLVFKHHLREQGRNHMKWNIAGDYVVNEMLEEAGFLVDEHWLRHTGYNGMCAEEIYNLIPEVKIYGSGKGKGKSGSSGNGDGESGNSKGNGEGFMPGDFEEPGGQDGGKMSPAERAQAEQEADKIVRQAANIAKARGDQSGMINKIIESMEPGKIPWREILRDFVTDQAKGDTSWKMPNKRFMAQGIYLPDNISESELCHGLAYIDASGSVCNSELEEYANEMTSIIEEFTNIKLTVNYFDTKVSKTRDEFSTENLPVTMRPEEVGGGTFFPCVFEDIENNNFEPKFLLFFTDLGDNHFPETPPNFPVLWIATNKGYGDPPFGKVLRLYEYKKK